MHVISVCKCPKLNILLCAKPLLVHTVIAVFCLDTHVSWGLEMAGLLIETMHLPGGHQVV